MEAENVSKSCCITGHREIPAEKIEWVEQALKKAIRQAIKDGFTHFMSGFAPGADMIFAKLVIAEQARHSGITLEAALPYPNWMKNRSKEDKALLEKCSKVEAHSPKYVRDCYFLRNRYLALSNERVLAVYDGREAGGTVKTMQYAAAMGRDIRKIMI